MLNEEKWKNFLDNDQFARHVGIELLEMSPGRAKAKMEIKSHHLNSVGIVHGAALFALADLVFAMASNSHGNIALAINANISYFQAAEAGTLIATGQEISFSPRLANYKIDITNERDELIATFQGMVYRKREHN
ncbi:MAG: PaaI family thioesterase [Firmicutes bacterium]|nr:PaaI family thioesterase [Bacillota bacterium]